MNWSPITRAMHLLKETWKRLKIYLRIFKQPKFSINRQPYYVSMKDIKNRAPYIVVLFGLLSLFISGCKSSSRNQSDTAPPTQAALPPLAPIEFADSYYYVESNTGNQWRTIAKVNLDNGNIPTTITIPSSIVTQSVTSAGQSIKKAPLQIDPTGVLYSDPVTTYNKVPYFTLKKQDNVTKYAFEYKRYSATSASDMIGVIQAQYNGEFDIDGKFAYLPVVNDKFGGKLFDSNTSNLGTSTIIHSISITALSDKGLPSPIKTFTFKINLQVEVKGVSTKTIPGIQNNTLPGYGAVPLFDLKNRWSAYYTSDGIPNPSYDVAMVTNGNTATAEPTSTDIRFVFQTTPVLRMRQELFVEETMDLDAYKRDQTITLRRGVFKNRTIELNSVDHFHSSFKVNGVVEPLLTGHEIVHRNIPANTSWNLVMSYDFRANSTYNPSLPLLNPLRPECLTTINSQFSPITDFALKQSVSAAGGFYATCHPDTDVPLNVNSSQLQDAANANQSGLRDTWNEYFAYRNERPNSTADARIEDAGHFYGIKSVKFYASGCMKYFIRQATDTTAQLIPWPSTPNNIPSSASELLCGGEPGWSYFEFEITDDISNHIDELMTSHPDQLKLIPLINAIPNYMNQTRPDYIFNGTVNLNSIF